MLLTYITSSVTTDTFGRKKALGPKQQNQDHTAQNEGIAIRREPLRQERLQRHLRGSQHDTTNNRARQASQPADNCSNERLQNRRETHQRIYGGALCYPQQGP